MDTQNNINAIKHSSGLVSMHHYIDTMPKVRKANDKSIKLEKGEVYEVIKNLEIGGSIGEIANMYVVSPRVISRIYNGSGHYKYILGTPAHLEMQRARMHNTTIKDINAKPRKTRLLSKYKYRKVIASLSVNHIIKEIADLHKLSIVTIYNIKLARHAYVFLKLDSYWIAMNKTINELNPKFIKPKMLKDLTDSEIFEIIELVIDGNTIKSIASAYNVNNNSVIAIRNGSGIVSHLKNNILWIKMRTKLDSTDPTPTKVIMTKVEPISTVEQQTFTVSEKTNDLELLLGPLYVIDLYVTRAEKYIINHPIIFDVQLDKIARVIYSTLLLKGITDMTNYEITQHIKVDDDA